MVICLEHDYERLDKRLNAIYKVQLDALDKTGRILLRDAQRAWIRFRDAECNRARDAERGGTLASVLGSNCMVELTHERIKQLEEGSEMSAKTSEGIFWHDSMLTDRFNCTEIQEVRFGLVSGFDSEKGKLILSARVNIGSETLDFPIGGETQDAFCAPPMSMEIYYAKNGCPGIRVDDGMCDAIFINWDKAGKGYIWTRN